MFRVIKMNILVTVLLYWVQVEGVYSWDWKDIVGIVKNPIDKTLITIGNSKCSYVKRLVGVEYDQISGLAEPDMSQLTLNFISRELEVTINLDTAPRVLSEMDIDHSRKLIIFFHGFLDDPHGFNFRGISNAFLKTGEYNILGLDASSLIRFLYLRSSTCVRFVGDKVGQLLEAMIKKGLDPGSVHLIGHSLGAHIAGFAGKRAAAAGARLGRLTALDPAGPCFSDVEPALRVQAGDARFVDVIHTDGGVFGLTEPLGHVDFYPNGGSQQAGCLTQTCSHLRVVELFAESVLYPDNFIAKACCNYTSFKLGLCSNDTSVMGFGTPPSARGVYYLRSAGRAPYGLGRRGTLYNDLF